MCLCYCDVSRPVDQQNTKVVLLLYGCCFVGYVTKKWYFVTKIVLTYCEKNCSSDREKLLKFEAEGQEFAKFLGQILISNKLEQL